jgi:hypothetical protein
LFFGCAHELIDLIHYFSGSHLLCNLDCADICVSMFCICSDFV